MKLDLNSGADQTSGLRSVVICVSIEHANVVFLRQMVDATFYFGGWSLKLRNSSAFFGLLFCFDQKLTSRGGGGWGFNKHPLVRASFQVK